MINLVPDKYFINKKYLLHKKRLALAILLLLFVLSGISYKNKNYLNDLLQEVRTKQQIQSELLNQKEEILFWQEKANQKDEYQNAFNNFKNKITYDKLFADLNFLLNSDLKLSQLLLDNGRIILIGQALNQDAITDSLNNLKENSFYSEFKIQSFEQKEEKILFSLEGELKINDEVEVKEI